MKELLQLQHEVLAVKRLLEAYYAGEYTWEEMLLRLAIDLAKENKLHLKNQRVRRKLEEMEDIEEAQERVRLGISAFSMN